MHPFSHLLLLASLPLLFAAGCSSVVPSQTLPVSVKEINVCDLLDSSSASGVLGGVVESEPGPSVASGDGFVSTCLFSSDQARSINVLLRRSPTSAEAARIFADSKDASQSAGFTLSNLQKLGDGAFWVGAPQNQLTFLSQNDWFVITVFGLPEDDRLTIAKKAASALLRGL